jgi:aminoglycoside 3'-phosphotransferase II
VAGFEVTPDSPAQTLAGEAARLRWLGSRTSVPHVVDFVQDSTHEYLLQEALPGEDAASTTLPPAEVVDLLADSLRNLHAVSIHDCPFIQSIDACLKESKGLLDSGCVDVTNFDPVNQGRDPGALYREMLATRPDSESEVLIHGDYCLPNVLIAEGHLSGFVDVGRSGVGDPYRDLALIGRSLKRNFGSGWEPRFFSRYGLIDPDPLRMRFFRLLDEFF